MNAEREAFGKKVGAMPKGDGAERHSEGGSKETKMIHHPDGKVELHHPDGEKSEHPNMAHAAMHLHAKHEDGEASHLHVHPDGAATTHHVGMDGMVEGPQEHGSVQEATDHMNSVHGDGEESAGMAPEHDMGDDTGEAWA